MSKIRPTQNQMKFLVDQMANDPQMYFSKFTKAFTHKIAQQRWENIAVELNSLPGAEKNYWQKWKKTWQDTRNITKTKAAAIKRNLGGTGGGPSCSVELNAIQIESLPLLSEASISGHSDSVESIVQFDFDGSTKDVITETEELCMDDLVESYYICNYSENESPALIAEETVNSTENENSYEPSNLKLSTTINRPTQPKLKRKMTVTSKLSESNTAANRLANIAERKCDMKAAYYDKKFKLMEENNVTLKNLETLFSEFVNRK